MQILKSLSDARQACREIQGLGHAIGFVPTMGALHRGHLSLVRVARGASDVVVMSIFVNPLQFNNQEDLLNYPRTEALDVSEAKNAGVDILFIPTAEELFGAPCGGKEENRVTLLAGSMSKGLCGTSRPGHFDGVVTIVATLFNIIQPQIAVFGEKDFQQLKVVEQMVSDLCFPVRILPGSLVRDEDGLALSSRNLRLSEKERVSALAIPRALGIAAQMTQEGVRSAIQIITAVRNELAVESGVQVDYIEIVDTETMEQVSEMVRPARLLVAAYVGSVRLIDNVLLPV